MIRSFNYNRLDARADGEEESRGAKQVRSEDIHGVFCFFIEKDLGTMSVGLDINH